MRGSARSSEVAHVGRRCSGFTGLLIAQFDALARNNNRRFRALPIVPRSSADVPGGQPSAAQIVRRPLRVRPLAEPIREWSRRRRATFKVYTVRREPSFLGA